MNFLTRFKKDFTKTLFVAKVSNAVLSSYLGTAVQFATFQFKFNVKVDSILDSITSFSFDDQK